MFNYTDSDGDVRGGKVVAHIVLGLILLTLFFGSFGIVRAGQRGVLTRLGAVTGNVKTPGLYFKLPLIEGVTKMDVQTQKEQVDASAASSDLQTVTAKVALNYSLNPDAVGQLYQKVGVDYKARIIDPAIQEAIKASTAKFTAEELITKREDVKGDIKTHIAERLQASGIDATDVNIINFDFSPSFNAAIEAKVTAEQNALAAKNKLEQVKFEAQQTIESAKAQAESIRIQAQAISQQGGREYVNAKAVEKWNGVLPQYMLGNSTPFINVNQ